MFDALDFQSRADAVGHCWTAIPNGVPWPLPLTPLARFRCRRASQDSRLSPSLKLPALGVGHFSASARFTCIDNSDP
jgi:hypothetical protein